MPVSVAVQTMPPLALEIPYRDPLEAFAVFADQPYAIFLDSALAHERLGRYSFIAADPFLTIESRDGMGLIGEWPVLGNPLDTLREALARYPLAQIPEAPPFQTGVAGYFGYDLGRHFEEIPSTRIDDLPFPDLALGFYDVVLAFDHRDRKGWILSSGYPEESPLARRERAAARAEEVQRRLADAPTLDAAPCVPEPAPVIESNFTRSAYEAMVQRVIDYILAGDIFQANLSQRFRTQLPPGFSPFDLYRRLRGLNTAPFAAYFNCGEVVLASSSPERFLKLRNGRVETRPIKGTRRRGWIPAEDDALALALLQSEKDRAENVMIVDLLRNDLSRVCQDDSVEVPELCTLETYATVYHLVSTVIGTLKPGATAVDLLEACFPGGSITGAPKIRAMEIIAELEPTRRGPYCGSIGYIGFDGSMDTNILIRTYAIHRDTVVFQAGGGIVADSKPADEYEETLSKAKALVAALSP